MATASILPSPRAVFYDSNGNPLNAGLVYTYVPSTTTFKQSWQDAGETIPNANPIVLDSAGSCLLYGSGSYQVTVTDSLGNAVPAYSGVTEDIASVAIAAVGGTISSVISSAMLPVVGAASTAAAELLLSGKTFPTSALTLYVNNSTGSDANPGTQVAPFLTIQHAVNVLCSQYVLSGTVPVTIQLQTTAVAYNEAVLLLPWCGSGNVSPGASFTCPVIQGNSANSSSVTVAPTNGNAFTAVGVTTPWAIAYMTLAPANGHGIESDYGSILYHFGLIFGATPNGSHLDAIWDSKIEALRTAPFTISGGAQAHANAVNGGKILTQSGVGTITLTGSPAFSSAFAIAQQGGVIDYSSAAFSGTGTGPQSLTDELSTILGPTNFAIGMGLPTGTLGQLFAGNSDMEVRALVGDAGYSMQFYSRIIASNVTLTAPRTWTLPLAKNVPVGQIIYLCDGGAINGANTITIATQGGDTFTSGGTSYVMSTAGKCTAVMSAGSGSWYRLIT